jgi:hypothetical protein
MGHLSGHCHVVARQSDREWVAVCTKHYDWFDGSTMTAHATEIVGPDNRRITEKLVIAGGFDFFRAFKIRLQALHSSIVMD